MNELVKLENLKAVDIFSKNGFDKTFDEIKDFAEKQVFDVETSKGRKEIASLARKVSSSKVLIDNLGKDLVSEEKARLKLIDIERGNAREKFDKLRDKIRLPLTNWENKEKKRVVAHINKIQSIKSFSSASHKTSKICDENIKKLELIIVDQNCQEFEEEARVVHTDAMLFLKNTRDYLLKKEEANTLVEKLKKERAEIEEQKRKDRIEKDAKEKAENEAKEELQKVHREKIEQKIRDEQKIKRLEQEEKDAYDEACIDKKQALERQRQWDKAAADKKRAEIEKQKRMKHDAEEKRKANVEHQRTINNSIYNDLIKVDCPDFIARDIVRAIARNEIKYVSINY